MSDALPALSSALPERIMGLLRAGEVHEAVREFHELTHKEPAGPLLRVEFADRLAGHGWAEEAFQQLRQALPPAAGDGILEARCLAVLDSLSLPAARALSAEVRAGRVGRQRRSRLLLLAWAATALAIVLAAELARQRVILAGKHGPDMICREFAQGTATDGLPRRARGLGIFRLVLSDEGGRTVLDKPLAELAPADWKELERRLAGLRGRVVFTNPPSMSVNRWCIVDFAGGRVVQAAALSHSP